MFITYDLPTWKGRRMSTEHRTITFTEIDVEIEEESEDELAFPVSSVTIEETVVEEEEEEEAEEAVVEDIEGEDPELVKHAKEIEERQSGLRKFQPPSSLQLVQKSKDVVFKDGKDAIGAGPKARKQSTAQHSSSDIGVFDFDIDFDLDKAEDVVDYSVYENRTGLAEDMKFLASMPE